MGQFLLILICILTTELSSSFAQHSTSPLTIGETFTIKSQALNETRRINVFLPQIYHENKNPLPVLYMPDGGIQEDFLHIAGLLQVSIGNETMRPFILVGIENTQRRRDLTGPTEVESDKKIAPQVGGSATFRSFIRNELMPEVKNRYRTTKETAIVGESLAGLFVIETFLLENDLFDTYIAFDPSLWWNNQKLIREVEDRLEVRTKKILYIASSNEKELADGCQKFADILSKNSMDQLKWYYKKMPTETHGTIYHPAAIAAFREVFKNK